MPAGELPDVFAGVEDRRARRAGRASARPSSWSTITCTATFNEPVDRADFEASINEGSTDPVPELHDPVRLSARAFHPALVRTAAGARAAAPAPTTTGRAAASSPPTSWPGSCCPRRASARWIVDTGFKGDLHHHARTAHRTQRRAVLGDPAAGTTHRGPARGRDVADDFPDAFRAALRAAVDDPGRGRHQDDCGLPHRLRHRLVAPVGRRRRRARPRLRWPRPAAAGRRARC